MCIAPRESSAAKPGTPPGLGGWRSLLAPAALFGLVLAGLLGLLPLDYGHGLISQAHAFQVFQKPMKLKPTIGKADRQIVLAMSTQSPPTPLISPRRPKRLILEPTASDIALDTADLPEVEIRQLFYWPTVKEMSRRHKLDPALVMALIQVESGFDPDAVSNMGAMGLMQIVPATADDLHLVAPFDPEANIEAGVRYLAWLSKIFERNERLILAAYNAGPTKILKTLQVPQVRETRRYIARVQMHRNYFKRRLARWGGK